ncbi:uncharacterized protein [Palaemon carinicauda]|uniref:uncharacterized protein n=1 Tax=Palaemon carinicauda TaxID=392227 RepID=UPI0035B6262D
MMQQNKAMLIFGLLAICQINLMAAKPYGTTVVRTVSSPAVVHRTFAAVPVASAAVPVFHSVAVPHVGVHVAGHDNSNEVLSYGGGADASHEVGVVAVRRTHLW